MKDSQQKKNVQQPRLQWCDGVLLMHIQTSAYKICFRGFHTEKKTMSGVHWPSQPLYIPAVSNPNGLLSQKS